MDPAAKTDSVDMLCRVHAVTGDHTSVELATFLVIPVGPPLRGDSNYV